MPLAKGLCSKGQEDKWVNNIGSKIRDFSYGRGYLSLADKNKTVPERKPSSVEETLTVVGKGKVHRK